VITVGTTAVVARAKGEGDEAKVRSAVIISRLGAGLQTNVAPPILRVNARRPGVAGGQARE
jgi:Na+-driven multidrug efflux pump